MSYRFNVSGRRVTRRGVLRGGTLAAAGLAGAALIGCGGSSSSAPTAAAVGSSGTSTAGTAASTSAAATGTAATAAAQPRAGGTLRYPTSVNADSLDSLTSASYKANYPSGFGYSRMMRFKTGDGEAASGELEGDAVESWEQPDDNTVIFHMRQNMKFDARPPTNGRMLTAEDVVKSFDTFASNSAYRSDLVNSVTPNAPVTKWEAVDDHTVQFTLAFPDATFLPTLAWPQDFWVEPVEAAEGKYDAKSDMRGTGPFVMEEFKSGVSYSYKRNPDWYGGPDRPWIERAEVAIVSDPAQIEAQLKAGNFDHGGNLVPLSDVPSLVKSAPNLQAVSASPSATGVWSFNYGSTDMWDDERVRQAISMSIDRDALAQVLYTPDKLEEVGLKTRIYWNSPLSPGLGKQWLDPKSSDYGDAAKYLHRDVAEAKKLLSAAGYDDRNPLTFEYVITPQYWKTDWEERAQTIQAMAADAGIKIEIYSTPYTSDWVPNYLRAKTKAVGHKMVPCVAQFTGSAKSCATQTYVIYYTSWGGNTMVADHFPDLDAKVSDLKQTIDADEQMQKTYDITRYMMQHMIVMPAAAVIDNVDVASKKLRGYGRYQAWPGGFGGAPAPTEQLPDFWFEA